MRVLRHLLMLLLWVRNRMAICLLGLESLLLLYRRRCCVELALKRLLRDEVVWLLQFLSCVRNWRILCLLGLKCLLLLLYWRRRCCVYVTLERPLVVDEVARLLYFLSCWLSVRAWRVI